MNSLTREYRTTSLAAGVDKSTVDYLTVLKEQTDDLARVWLYIHNLPKGAVVCGEIIAENPTADAQEKLASNNSTPDWLARISNVRKINVDDHGEHQEAINKMSAALNAQPGKFVKFVKSLSYPAMSSLKQVIDEQHRYITADDQHADAYYLEIYGQSGKIVSMFVKNLMRLPEARAQLHFFIVNDLKYLVDGGRDLPYSSIFMHSFASSLFGNKHWYTNPVGSMEGILGANLKKESIRSVTPQEEKALIAQIDAAYPLCTSSSVTPHLEFKINNFMNTLWKTREFIRPTPNDEKTREVVGLACNYEKVTTDHATSYMFKFPGTSGAGSPSSSQPQLSPVFALVVCVLTVIFLFLSDAIKRLFSAGHDLPKSANLPTAN